MCIWGARNIFLLVPNDAVERRRSFPSVSHLPWREIAESLTAGADTELAP